MKTQSRTDRLRDRHPEREDLHNVPLNSQGTDAAKKIVGRKRGIITDTLGLLLAVTVTAASRSENAVGIQLLDQAKKTYPTISKSWVDTGFKNAVIEHGAKLGIDVEVASIDNLAKRITDETTPTWRGTY